MTGKDNITPMLSRLLGESTVKQIHAHKAEDFVRFMVYYKPKEK